MVKDVVVALQQEGTFDDVSTTIFRELLSNLSLLYVAMLRSRTLTAN